MNEASLEYIDAAGADQDLSAARRALELDDNLAEAHVCLAGDLVDYYGRMGHAAEARKVLADLQTQSKSAFIAPSMFPKVCIGLGNTEQAFAWLEKGYQQHDFWLTFITREPVYDPLRSDPRFQELVRRIGFPHL